MFLRLLLEKLLQDGLIKMIKLKNISKSFGDVNVLDNVSYEIEEGKITSILGPSGVGKTTLLNIMSGILKADSGEIHVA